VSPAVMAPRSPLRSTPHRPRFAAQPNQQASSEITRKCTYVEVVGEVVVHSAVAERVERLRQRNPSPVRGASLLRMKAGLGVQGDRQHLLVPVYVRVPPAVRGVRGCAPPGQNPWRLSKESGSGFCKYASGGELYSECTAVADRIDMEI
jgi:hypothetical protein